MKSSSVPLWGPYVLYDITQPTQTFVVELHADNANYLEAGSHFYASIECEHRCNADVQSKGYMQGAQDHERCCVVCVVSWFNPIIIAEGAKEKRLLNFRHTTPLYIFFLFITTTAFIFHLQLPLLLTVYACWLILNP